MDTGNRLLDSLTAHSRDLITAQVTQISLPLGQVLYAANETPRYAYFLTAGLAAIVVSTIEGETAEVGIIGREGVVGGLHLLGPASFSNDCTMQIKGEGFRLRLQDLKTAFRSSEEIREALLEFAQEQALSLSQVAGCNRLHDAEPRLACWFLMTQDHVQSDVLSFTQEFLGRMLGTQRTTVTLAAGQLQRRGCIEYARGKVRILDRAELLGASCGCYEVFKELFDSLYKRPHTA